MSKSGLEGKVVIITGASSGIGAGAAKYFAACGSRLSLVGRNMEALTKIESECRGGGARDVITLSHDLAHEDQCEAVVTKTLEHFKSIDVLVHCAGILINGSIETLSVTDYDKIMNINTRSAFIMTQLVTPHIISTKGNIVHVSSVTGLRSFPGVLGYCVSKAALDQLVRCAALDLADKGVRVNAVNPGVIVTEVHKNSGMSEEAYQRFLEHSKTTHALGRVGTADEVADLIGFLASDSASFITGQTIAIDGGRSIMCPR